MQRNSEIIGPAGKSYFV